MATNGRVVGRTGARRNEFMGLPDKAAVRVP